MQTFSKLVISNIRIFTNLKHEEKRVGNSIPIITVFGLNFILDHHLSIINQSPDNHELNEL